MTEAPEICSFTPLGEFLLSATRREVDPDALSGFISRAVEHGINLAPFVRHAFGIRVPLAPNTKQKKYPKPKICAEQNRVQTCRECCLDTNKGEQDEMLLAWNSSAS